MVRFFAAALGLGLLAACQPTLPDSAAGVGFDNSIEAQKRREAALAQSGTVAAPVPAPQPVSSQPLATPPATASADPAAQPLPASVTTAVNGTDTAADTRVEASAANAAAAANSGVAPVDASPSNPAPLQLDNPGISSEQDFDTVSSQRSIESDAQRIAANRAQYTVIEPTALPTRPGTNQPNIVEYALRTKHPVGTQLYRRIGLKSAQRHARACAAYPSADVAQIEFLQRGGPERDRKGVDPDGDGYACSWDPAPFRRAGVAAAASQPAETAVIADPLAISTED